MSNRRRIPIAPAAALAVGAVLTLAYGWVLDDAFVYFRYADNAAALGYGLVYNRGEYVEGFTSPAWMMLLLGARVLGLRFWPLVMGVGLAALMATWALAVRANRRCSDPSRAEVQLPAIWITCCYAVEAHFTSGLETPLVQALAAAFAALVFEPGVAWLQILVGLGPLVRPELNLAVAVATVWCWRREGTPPWCLVAAAGLGQAAWLAFRVYYYADLVPNTFHLKDAADVPRGLAYLHDTLRAYHLYPMLAGLAALLLLVARRRGVRAAMLGPRAVLWLTAALHTAYVVRIGGDFVHYRYLAFPVIVLVASLGGVIEHFLRADRRRDRLIAVALGLAAVVTMVLAYPSALLPAHPLKLRPEADPLVLYRSRGIEDSASHRLRFDLQPASWDTGPLPAAEALRLRASGYHHAIETGWCREGYAHLDWFVVQSFGLTDPVLAHTVDPRPSRQAGHRWTLLPLARDVAHVWQDAIGSLTFAEPDAFERSVRAGHGAPWLTRNLPALSHIGERTRGPRGLLAGLRRAREPWPRLEVSTKDVARARHN